MSNPIASGAARAAQARRTRIALAACAILFLAGVAMGLAWLNVYWVR
jgi:hypothetical protein